MCYNNTIRQKIPRFCVFFDKMQKKCVEQMAQRTFWVKGGVSSGFFGICGNDSLLAKTRWYFGAANLLFCGQTKGAISTEYGTARSKSILFAYSCYPQ
jgi:hypothetical protein